MEIDECDVHVENHQNNKQMLFRDEEKDFLINFFGPRTSLPYQCLFIYGNTATGKTYLVSNLLKELNLPHTWINCYEHYTPQLMFASILEQLSLTDCYKISNVHEFVQALISLLKDRKETTYLIFDNAELLRIKNSYLLPSLLQLQHLTELNISSIFISELPWIVFVNENISIEPISLHFSSYSKEQLIKILAQDCPEDYDQSFYEGYINIILKTFYMVTRNLNELRHLAHINFQKYCEPLASEDDDVTAHRLWKNIEPTLKEAMNSVYIREVSGSKWKSIQNKESSNVINEIKLASSYHSSKLHVARELPFYSKFLLLASYFASYNSPKTDFKHFVKNQGKQKKIRTIKKKEKNRHLLGPKPFLLDRMLSIFFSIVGEKVIPSALIFSQVSSLVNMKLLVRISADEQLENSKYKCLAELDLVEKIGKTINIDVMGYLDDFL